MIEKWEYIEGFEGMYQVSNMGLVKSVRRTKPNVPNAFVKEKILIPNNTGFVQLHKENTSQFLHVGRLVANTFVPNPDNYKFIGYKNNNCMDFVFTNLKWSDSVFCNRNDKHNIYRNLV